MSILKGEQAVGWYYSLPLISQREAEGLLLVSSWDDMTGFSGNLSCLSYCCIYPKGEKNPSLTLSNNLSESPILLEHNLSEK